jgi:hypothetical protein
VNEQLAYLKMVLEGAPNIEPWRIWFAHHDSALGKPLSRGDYLRLKLHRIAAIPEILDKFGITYMPSERYAWLAGIPGQCRDCGSQIITEGNVTWCPNGCFRLHALRRPDTASDT